MKKEFFYFVCVLALMVSCRKPLSMAPQEVVPVYALKPSGQHIFSLDQRLPAKSTNPSINTLRVDLVEVSMEQFLTARKISILKRQKVLLHKVTANRYAIQVDVSESETRPRFVNFLFDEEWKGLMVITSKRLPLAEVPWDNAQVLKDKMWGYNIWYGDIALYYSNANFVRVHLAR